MVLCLIFASNAYSLTHVISNLIAREPSSIDPLNVIIGFASHLDMLFQYGLVTIAYLYRYNLHKEAGLK